MVVDHDNAWMLGLALIVVGGLLAFGLPTFMDMLAGSRSVFLTDPKRRRLTGIILMALGGLLFALSVLEHFLHRAW